jgi:hypothetical protein
VREPNPPLTSGDIARIFSAGTSSAVLRIARWRTTPWLPEITV